MKCLSHLTPYFLHWLTATLQVSGFSAWLVMQELNAISCTTETFSHRLFFSPQRSHAKMFVSPFHHIKRSCQLFTRCKRADVRSGMGGSCSQAGVKAQFCFHSTKKYVQYNDACTSQFLVSILMQQHNHIPWVSLFFEVEHFNVIFFPTSRSFPEVHFIVQFISNAWTW